MRMHFILASFSRFLINISTPDIPSLLYGFINETNSASFLLSEINLYAVKIEENQLIIKLTAFT